MTTKIDYNQLSSMEPHCGDIETKNFHRFFSKLFETGFKLRTGFSNTKNDTIEENNGL